MARAILLFVVWNVCGFFHSGKLTTDWAKIMSIYPTTKKKLMNFLGSFVTSFRSLQSIFARSVLDAWSRFARIIRHASLVQQHISNAVCNAMVSGEGEYMTITYFVSFENENKKNREHQWNVFRRKWEKSTKKALQNRESKRDCKSTVVTDDWCDICFIGITSPTSFVWFSNLVKNANFRTHRIELV